MAEKRKTCVLIPAYREEARVGAVVAEALAFCPNVVVIDDGSPDGTAEAARAAGAKVLSLVRNAGKVEALRRGFRYAEENGYDLAITMDADGRHAPSDIPAFLAAYERTKSRVLAGNRMNDTRSMPAVRRRINRFLSGLLSELMRRHVPDTQCGFRLYERSAFPLFDPEGDSRRFAAESEILVRLALKGVSIGSVAVQTVCGTEKGKIHPVRDTLRFLRTYLRLRRLARGIPRP
ncbi:MAG: glycosyltransferase family 2 protein [Kiritimatiellae bacterium]|nr:glycosyltransferase family 2 protein [Kiritimatiellia bacterium]